MLCENDQTAIERCQDTSHETSVLVEPSDVSLISGVEQDRSRTSVGQAAGCVPIGVGNEISLREICVADERKVVQSLRIEFGHIRRGKGRAISEPCLERFFRELGNVDVSWLLFSGTDG